SVVSARRTRSQNLASRARRRPRSFARRCRDLARNRSATGPISAPLALRGGPISTRPRPASPGRFRPRNALPEEKNDLNDPPAGSSYKKGGIRARAHENPGESASKSAPQVLNLAPHFGLGRAGAAPTFQRQNRRPERSRKPGAREKSSFRAPPDRF